VTGGNAGIGYISARELAKKGCNVTVIARSLEKGQKAVADILEYAGRKDGVELAHIDMADLKAVKAFAEGYLASGKPLHILMNNAGWYNSA
jgi:NAD(P)-dependent dehydrogenase (short-subunit alcohol dehydrogenase family)